MAASLASVEAGGDLGVRTPAVRAGPALVPGLHRMALHELVGPLPRQPGLGQRQQHPLRAVEAVAGVQIAPHPLGVDHEPLDQSAPADAARSR